MISLMRAAASIFTPGVLAILALATLTSSATAQTPDTPCVGVNDAGPHSSFDVAASHLIARGAGVRVAVIDTGVAPHPQLREVVPVIDLVARENPDPLLDCDGHGTIVAGVIGAAHGGVAPGAIILSIRQSSAHYRNMSADTSGTLATLAEAIHEALDADAQVINTSVVSCMAPEQAALLDATVLHQALHRAEAENAVVVSAAGNVGPECQPGMVVFPAHEPTVLAVGAWHSSDPHSLTEYSLPGDAQVSAPGLVAAGLSPTARGWASAVVDEHGQSRSFEGTSFAAPVVAGVAALLRERYPDESAEQLRARIQQSAQPGSSVVDPHIALTHLAGDYSVEPRSIMAELPTTDPQLARSQAKVLLGALSAATLVGVVLAGLIVPSRSGRHKG